MGGVIDADDGREINIQRGERKNACAFGFVLILLCSVLSYVVLFGFALISFMIVSLFVALVTFVLCLFDCLLNMLYESFPR